MIIYVKLTEAERRVIDEYFPVKGGKEEREERGKWRERVGQGSRGPGGRVAEEGLAPGEQYAIYKTGEAAGEVPESSEVAIGRAGLVTGTGAELVGRVAETFERRLLSWWQREKRRLGSEEAPADQTGVVPEEQADGRWV